MPIRFACPHCRQKLSISSRKAGQHADCPRCKRSLTIPPLPEAVPALGQPPVELPEFAFPSAVEAPQEMLAAAEVAPVADAPRKSEPIVSTTAALETPAELPQPAGIDPVFVPDIGEGFEGLELVYDAPESRAVAPPPVAADLISIPRYAIYLQGGLLAVVAFVAFAIGLLAGGTFLSGPAAPAAPQACLLTGSVTYSSGPRQLPDEGAVIAVLPVNHNRESEKAPIAGLRPGDPTPDVDHRGLAILKQLGGGYTRADASGRFQIRVPDRGRYLVLAISREKPARSADEINTADILKLGPYFVNAADLLGDRRYQLTPETLRGDKQLSIAFQ
jgi:hypothetical protein